MSSKCIRSELLSICTFILVFFTAVSTASSRSPRDLVLIRQSTAVPTNATSSLQATRFGSNFDVNVTFGNQTFLLLADTGSSDTYVMRSGFRCFNWTDGAELPQSGCFYGNATYTPTGTISEIANETFGVEYGAGIASGVMAYEDITLAGITLTGQKVGIANSSSPNGDGVYSGILGLAYPALTSAHPGTNVSNTTFFFDRLPYNPLLYNMHQRGLIDPYFSLVLARTPQNSSSGFGGYLTLGNLPPVKYSNTFARAPVEVTEVLPLNFTSNQRVLSYWSTTISGVVYGPGPNNTTTPSAPQPNNITTSSTITNGTSFHALFDSGVTSIYLPTSIVSSVNALFLPPAALMLSIAPPSRRNSAL